MNISFERIFGTKPCNNKNYYTVLLPYKSDKIRYNNESKKECVKN